MAKKKAQKRKPVKTMMAKKPTKILAKNNSKASSPVARTTGSGARGAKRLYPPDGGAIVRFYRIGHGDCFLIALAGESSKKPVYVLIDCGYKPGSSKTINTSAAEIWNNIQAATGGHLDVVAISHEHQDHVNGFTSKNLDGITIGETWLAWTEDPEDDLANRLRRDYDDKLRGLVAARNRLAAAGDQEQIEFVDQLLEFELGADSDFDFAAASNAIAGSGGTGNKASIALVKKNAKNGVKFIRPHERILHVPGAKDVRVYALGPPRDEDSLRDMDPQGGEEFPGPALAMASPGNFFAAAASATPQSPVQRLFAARYEITLAEAPSDPTYGGFFSRHYGVNHVPAALTPLPSNDSDEAPDNAAWRRIDYDWLASAGQLALDLNTYTNNTSLVLAFELGPRGKVLLFAADAQRGNWLSWASKEWKDGDKTISVRDVLARTVLYKVGHHCSHNATLNGTERDDYANISWMALGQHAGEFSAMITAVWAWAKTQKGWNHPYPPIKNGLLKKASGRVFQTDTDFEDLRMPDGASLSDWNRFMKSAQGDQLYFDYTFLP